MSAGKDVIQMAGTSNVKVFSSIKACRVLEKEMKLSN